MFLFHIFHLFYCDFKSKLGFLFNNHHCHFYSIMQSSITKPTLLFLLILVQYTCTPCIVCNFSNLLKATQKKNILIIQMVKPQTMTVQMMFSLYRGPMREKICPSTTFDRQEVEITIKMSSLMKFGNLGS